MHPLDRLTRWWHDNEGDKWLALCVIVLVVLTALYIGAHVLYQLLKNIRYW